MHVTDVELTPSTQRFMETHAFASLAHIRILLIPVGLIPKATFEGYANELRSFSTLRLADIPTETKDGKAARFLPSPLSSGYLHISFPTHPPPRSHTPLSLVRPSQFPLAVIGIATCSKTDDLRSLFHQFNTVVSDLFPSGCTYPFVRNCFVFEESEGALNLDTAESITGVTIVPHITNRRLHLSTLLGVLCSQILIELGIMVQAMESPIGNEYLNAALMPTLPQLSELPSPLNTSKSEHISGIPSYSSQPEISRTFTLSSAPVLRRNASTTVGANRQSTLNVQTQKKRISAIGTSSSPGRLYKMLGDFFLLAGRGEDALIWYNEAAQIFRNSQDSLWYACTCEGIATVAIVGAWATGQGLNTSASAINEPWSDVIDKLQQALVLYQKVSGPDGEQVHSLLAFLYCGCVLRHASLLFAVWSAKGWGPLAFTMMLQPGLKPYIPPTVTDDSDDKWLSLERLTSLTGISRSTISGILGQLHGPWLLHLGQRERISVLEATASLYACLGYHRKEAYILREVLGCLLDLIVCGREEDEQPSAANVPQTAGLGIHNIHPVPGTIVGSVGVRLSESVAGNQSIMKLLSHISRVLGINLESVRLSAAKTPALSTLEDYDEDIIQELSETHGWPELQVGVVREAVAVAEALPDFPAVAQFSLSALKTLQLILSPGDQYHLFSTAKRALATARRRGDSRSVEYWSGRPVISISIAAPPGIRVPLERPRSLQHKLLNPAPLLNGIVDPFLYNPRKITNKGQTLIVQNEVVEFVITLQNPYIFDLEIEQLTLSTSGVPFISEPIHVIIPADALHQVVVTGIPTETGKLTIKGYFVRAPGGLTREYVLPLHTNEEESRIATKRQSILSETGRSKYLGPSWSKGLKNKIVRTSEPAPFKFLECKVIPTQPLLRIRRTTVTHGALMLYDGERSTIRITLENASTIPIDFLHFIFHDSTMEPAQKALDEGELSAFDKYEAEYSLINRPVFSWDKEDAKTILPNQNLTITLFCFGKVGCTEGTITISYAYAKDPNLEDSDLFYIRQVYYPLMVTVYHMLECSGMDILPFPSYPQLRLRKDESYKERFEHLTIDKDSRWCLFSIEVRNSYGTPFDITLLRTQEGVPSATSTTTIPPGSVSRLIIPIKKFVLNEDTICKPIPTLSEKQFVVATSNLSEIEERVQRELFWYRERLFNCVAARWQETGGTRSGELSFRTQRISSPMLETLRLEIAQLSLCLDIGGSCTDQIGYSGTRQHPKANEFIELEAKVTNLFACPIVCTLDIEISPTEYICSEGLLVDLPIGRLKSGEVRQFSISLCFLSCGEFEISGQVRGVGAKIDGRIARTHMTAMVTQ